MKWCTLQLKLRQRTIAQFKEELRLVEYKKKVYICELKKGSILGESDEESSESPVNYLEISS